MFGNYQTLSVEQVKDGVQKYGPAQGARKVIDWEYQHAVDAIQSAVYITWWNEEKKSECGRIGKNSNCFCGHKMPSHEDKYFAKKFNTSCRDCPCKEFRMIPIRPEECGMYWLTRRKDFNVKTWRPPCKCTHNHEQHNPLPPYRCKNCSNCRGFDSYFACISCDRRWEHHEVLYETEDERKLLKKPIREEFLPLSANKDIQELVFNDKPYVMNEQYTRPRPPQKKAITGQTKPKIQNYQPLTQQIQQQNMENQFEEMKIGNDQPFNMQQKQQQAYSNQQWMNQQNQAYDIRQNQQQQQQQSQYRQDLIPNNIEKKPFLKRKTDTKINYPVLNKNKKPGQTNTNTTKKI